MKQYILKYQDFLNIDESVLTKAESEKYSKIQVVQDVKAIHNKIFGDGEKIYIPFDFSHLESLDKSKTQKRVEYVLSKNGYEIISYSQNQCKKIDDTRIVAIGKVLYSKLNKEDLSVDYGIDVEKSRNLDPSNDMYVCISRNSDDIASMSTGRSWTSCQDLRRNTGYNYKVAEDLKQGSIIAYLIKSNDREINDPESRILIKPFINTKNSKDIILLPSTVSYYRGKNKKNYTPPEKYPNFYKFLMSWVKMVQPDMNGSYKMQEDVYQDGDTTAKLKRNYTDEEIERVEEPQNQDDLKLTFNYYDLDFSKVKFDEDGLIEYNGSLGISGSFNRLPKLFKFIKKIDGDLDLSYCPRLKSFKNLENLKSVKRILTIEERNNIKDVKALKNLQEVSKITPRNLFLDYMEMKNSKFKEGLENPKTEEDYLNILKFYGIEDVSKDRLLIGDGVVSYDGDIKLRWTKTQQDIENILKHFNIVGHLGFYNCDGLIDFKNFGNLKEIGKLTILYCPNFIGFEGLENCKIDGFDTNKKDLLKRFVESNETLKERMENPKSVEDFGLLQSVDEFANKLSLSNIKFDTDGLVFYGGDINFSYNKDFKQFPKWFKVFKGIGGTLDCSETSINSFTGLENLTEIGSLNCYETSITDFTGLNKLTEIVHGSLDCRETSIKDFTGLNNLTKIGGGLYCRGTSITSFTGLNNLTKIRGGLWCNETSITSFTGLDNLTEIGGTLDCSGSSITSFKGLEQCELNPDNIYPFKLREKYIEWKETLK